MSVWTRKGTESDVNRTNNNNNNTYSMKGPNLDAYCAKIAAFLQVLAPGPFRHDNLSNVEYLWYSGLLSHLILI